MKKMKLITMVIAFMFVFSLYSNGAVSALNLQQDGPYKIGIVYSTGGLGDQSFNDAAKRGIVDALDTHGDDISVSQLCETDCTIPDITNQIEVFASAEDPYDLIIGVGFSSADGIAASAAAHPNVNFMIIDAVVDLPNVASVVFKEQEGSFLVGAMAAMVTQTNKLGFLGGLDIPLINRFGAGFEHGARYINPDITVTVAYSPNPNNPWGDVSGGKAVAEGFIEEGIDIIFAAAGGTGGGVFEAVAEGNDAEGDGTYYGIGVDSDQDHLSPGNVLTSMIKRVDVAVFEEIDKVVSGTWSNGTSALGLAEDGTGISPMTFTQDEANAEYEDGVTRYDAVLDLKSDIVSGDIVVAETFDEVDAIDFGGEETSDEGFTPFPVLPAFLAIFSTIALVRRHK